MPLSQDVRAETVCYITSWYTFVLIQRLHRSHPDFLLQADHHFHVNYRPDVRRHNPCPFVLLLTWPGSPFTTVYNWQPSSANKWDIPTLLFLSACYAILAPSMILSFKRTYNREYFEPQNRNMNSRFHSDARLPLVMWDQSHCYFMNVQPIMSQDFLPLGFKCSLFKEPVSVVSKTQVHNTQ